MFFSCCVCFLLWRALKALVYAGFSPQQGAQQPAGVFVVVGVGFGNGTVAPRPPLMGLMLRKAGGFALPGALYPAAEALAVRRNTCGGGSLARVFVFVVTWRQRKSELSGRKPGHYLSVATARKRMYPYSNQVFISIESCRRLERRLSWQNFLHTVSSMES